MDGNVRAGVEAVGVARRLSAVLDVLLKAVEDGFEHLRDQVASATAEQLGQPSTHPRMKNALPTAADGIAFLLTGHLGIHLGQLRDVAPDDRDGHIL